MAVVDKTDTLTIVTSDNGTPEHAILPPLDPEQGKLSMFEGGINVPFFAVGPQVVPGTESTALVHLVDVLPTVAELAGVDPNALLRNDGTTNVVDGRSLLPVFADPDAPFRDVVYTEWFAPNGFAPALLLDERAVRDERYKLTWGLEAGEALFDLEGRTDDGPNLLLGTLTREQQAAYDRLSLALADFESGLGAAN